jgi:hypothetical protein
VEIDAHDIIGHVVPDLFLIHHYSLRCRLLEFIEKKNGFIRSVCGTRAGLLLSGAALRAPRF